MKHFILALSFLFTASAFAGEVITCETGPSQKIKITKENSKYFYSVNGNKVMNLGGAQTIQAKDLKGESTLLEIMSYIGINPKDLSRVNVYSLTRDDDGGKTIIRFIFKDGTYLAAYISMGSIKPCL